MIIHLINNCAWLLYHKMIPLCIVNDITCHISGFHSCVWARYPTLYTAFSICNFCSFCKNRSSRWAPLNLLFDGFSLTRRNFQFFADFTIFAIFAVFAKIAVLVRALSTPSHTGFYWLDVFSNFSQILQYSQFSQFSHKSQFLSGPSQPLLLQVFTDSTNFPIFCSFFNIRNFRSFRKNRSSRRGSLNPFFYRISLTWRNFPFFADFPIFAFSAKITVLVGALSTPSCTGFHWLDEFSNFLQILQYSQFLLKLQFLLGPSQLLLLQVFTDSTNFPIFRRFYNIRSFRKNRSFCRGPLNLLFYWFSLTWRIF